MGKNRPIVVATLGYIIGIIWGLYFRKNIVSFYVLISIFLMILKKIKIFFFKHYLKHKMQNKRKFKFISIKKIFRYIRLIMDFKSLIIVIIFSIISNSVVNYLNNKYESLYTGLESVDAIARVVDNGTNKQYKTTYKIKIEKINKENKYKGVYLYLDVNKNINLRYGDLISIQGEYISPSKATNYNGFDYSKYLKTLKIYGTIKVNKIGIISKNTNNILFRISNNIFLKIKETVQENLPEEKANLLLGILVGYKNEIPENIQEDFRQSNISHILAVSGLHVSYIILTVTNIFERLKGKRKARIITIFFIIIYMFITNFTPSVVRAGAMGIISILAKLTYNKNDTYTSINISLLLLLIYNPYLITTAGVLLSYGGTIGIIIFQKNILYVLKEIREKSKILSNKANSSLVKILNYLQDTIAVSFSAQLVIGPIVARIFNTVSLSFFITNFFISIIIGPIIILGFLFIVFNLLISKNIIFSGIQIIIKFIIEKLLSFLIYISKLGKSMPLNQIYIPTPEIWKIIIFYIVIFIINILYKISKKKKRTTFEKRLINWKNLIKHLIRKNNKKVITIMIVVTMLVVTIKIMPDNLKIYFVDVGQGDCTLVVTPQNKNILIDGGGSKNYDVGKNILLPYLLDRKITKIDYLIITHFDTDHVGGILTILKEIKVQKVIIGKQYENSDNYEEFLKIIKSKNINVKQISNGNKIKLEKDVEIIFLYPEKELINENSLNNNSLVFKLNYGKFSMLFTGDIEKVAEEKIIKLYNGTDGLKSTVLKVAHHGSKSSTIENFLKEVNPQIALIGVGKNNKFGHPNSNVLKRLEDLRNKNL